MSTVRPLGKGEHTLIGDIIGDSFSDDPINQWIFGSGQGMAGYYTLAAKKLYLPRGYGHVLDDSGGTLWLLPGTAKHIPLWNSLDIAAIMLRHGGAGALLRGLAVDGYLAKIKPKEPHYYLFAIGARQGCQGKGIGGKLMAAGLERANAEHMPVYLESSKESNVPFYRRFGFELIEKVTPAKGCPSMWPMWREPV
jgi:ribosomal protein S18 acetylase RimI-like enzyme